jgi:drug/metabolite transporter (DMT)-like permease
VFPPVNPSRTAWSRHDALLLLMAVIWGANFSIVKAAIEEIRPLAFNGLRLLLASTLFLVALGIARPGRGLRRIPARDWLAIGALGLIGHFVYQLCFISGLSRTTAGNSSLILGCSPVAVALLTSAAGHERVGARGWVAIALSVVGVYVLVGRAPSVAAESFAGDLLTIAAVLCWSVYTVGSRTLLGRYTPLQLTGLSMAIGTVPYLAVASPEILSLRWETVGAASWAALVFSAAFALFVSYLIWYSAVKRIGNIRTSVYSNTIPLVALLVAAVWLGERLTLEGIAGAAAILAGVAITRTSGATANVTPAEE